MPSLTPTLLIFYALLSSIIALALRVDEKSSSLLPAVQKVQAESYTQIQSAYYYILKEFSPYLFLKAQTINLWDGQSKAVLKSPSGDVYTSDGRIVHYKAKRGKVELKEQNLYLEDEVQIYDDNSLLLTDWASFLKKQDFFTAKGNVKSEHTSPQTKDYIYIESHIAHGWPQKEEAHYIGQVSGEIIRYRPYEPTTYFNGEKLEIKLKESHIQIFDNVSIFRANMKAYAHWGEIFLENYNKDLKYYALYDDVKIYEKVTTRTGEIINREAFSEKLEGLAKQRKIILTGYPRVVQGKDMIKGNTITFYEESDIVEVDGSHSNLIIK